MTTVGGIIPDMLNEMAGTLDSMRSKDTLQIRGEQSERRLFVLVSVALVGSLLAAACNGQGRPDFLALIEPFLELASEHPWIPGSTEPNRSPDRSWHRA